jgi:acyl dehydratase
MSPSSVNADLTEREFPETAPYLVGREKIRDFARAVFATSALHHDVAAARAAGYPDVIAPPTFAILIQEQTMGILLAQPATGIEYSRIVHGAQRFVYSRPIVAGDELTASLHVTAIRSLGDNALVTFESDICDASKQLVVKAISDLVVRGEE